MYHASKWRAENTLRHEFGHAMGLPHRSKGIMNYRDNAKYDYNNFVDEYSLKVFNEPYEKDWFTPYTVGPRNNSWLGGRALPNHQRKTRRSHFRQEGTKVK